MALPKILNFTLMVKLITLMKTINLLISRMLKSIPMTKWCMIIILTPLSIFSSANLLIGGVTLLSSLLTSGPLWSISSYKPVISISYLFNLSKTSLNLIFILSNYTTRKQKPDYVSLLQWWWIIFERHY
jgi:hypothetical protein